MYKGAKQNSRKYISLIIAILLYYIFHEGAHLIYALSIGTFRQINIMGYGLGVQIETYTQQMTDTQIGILCFIGAIVTLFFGYLLVGLSGIIVKSPSRLGRAIMYYTTIVFLLLDPLYLSIIYPFVGGGDMNGIALIVPETVARIIFGVIGLVNVFILIRYIFPKYKKAFIEDVGIHY